MDECEKLIELTNIQGSFRDPSGGVFTGSDGNIYRTISGKVKEKYDTVEASGVIRELEKEGHLIESRPEDIRRFSLGSHEAAAIVSHQRLPFISWPWEWGFEQLRAAALLHLRIHMKGLEKNVTLSDSTAFNIQFDGCKPVFIDRLSFIPYKEGSFWTGQKQFTEQFLTPLLLWSHTGMPPHEWYRGTMKGINIAHMGHMLPFGAKCSFSYLNYIFLPAYFEERQKGSPLDSRLRPEKQKLPKEGLLFLLRGLEKWITKLRPPKCDTFWKDYTSFRTYTEEEMQKRLALTGDFVSRFKPGMIWDIGCNNGEFLLNALKAEAGYAVGFDVDHGALAAAYRKSCENRAPFLPLYMDVCNPSPGQGWLQSERPGLRERCNADMVLAMAVLHHIVIGNNVPLPAATDFFLGLAPAGIIEWVPKSDPMIQNMLAAREDIFDDYDIDNFRKIVAQTAEILTEKTVSVSGRTLFAYKRK